MRSHFVIAFLCREAVSIETLGKAFKESLDGLGQALVPNTTAFNRHAKVVENRMSRLVFRNAIECDMFEGDRLFTGSYEEYAYLLPIGVCKNLTETPLGFDGMPDSISFLKRHTLVLVKANDLRLSGRRTECREEVERDFRRSAPTGGSSKPLTRQA
jgi:hypothetical protein